MEGRISKVGKRGILSAMKRVLLAGRGRGVSVYCVEKSDFGDSVLFRKYSSASDVHAG